MKDLNKITTWAKYKKSEKLNNINNVDDFLRNRKDFEGITIYRDKEITPFKQAHKLMLSTEIAGNKEISEVVYYTLSNTGRLKSLEQMVVYMKYA